MNIIRNANIIALKKGTHHNDYLADKIRLRFKSLDIELSNETVKQLELAIDNDIDAVILLYKEFTCQDIKTIKKIKYSSPNIPIMLVYSTSSDTELIMAFKSGVRVIQKASPINEKELKENIETIFSIQHDVESGKRHNLTLSDSYPLCTNSSCLTIH